MGRYEYIEHTADIGVRAYGDSLEEAFASAAEAMFALITDNAGVDPSETVTLTIESQDQEGLLVNFLSELIVQHETENLVLSGFEVKIDGNRLDSTMKGEKFSGQKHGGGTHVKAVSYHMLEIVKPEDDQQAYVQVLFDI